MGANNNDELQEERKKMKEQAKRQFITGMSIMIGCLLVVLVCTLIAPHNSLIRSKMDTIVKICSYAFYFGLFFIIRYHITRRKIPRDDISE